jgi:hypothetical protein
MNFGTTAILAIMWICTLIRESSSNLSINITLRMISNASNDLLLCPGDWVELSCEHTNITFDPAWRVRGKGLPNVGLATFTGERGIPNHKITIDTNTEDVLLIHPLRSEFNDYVYTCLYSIQGRDVTSSPVQLKVANLTEPVLDVRVYNITATSAAVMWSYVDTCKAVVGFQISLKDFTGAIVSNKSVPAGSRRAVLTDLRPLAQYQVLVMIKIKGGSISTAAMKVFNAGRRQSDDIIIQGGDSTRTCEEDLIVCAMLISVVTLIISIFAILLVVVVTCKVRRGCSRRQSSAQGDGHMISHMTCHTCSSPRSDSSSWYSSGRPLMGSQSENEMGLGSTSVLGELMLDKQNGTIV